MISPVDGSTYVERAPASDDHVESVLARSWAARAAWRRVPVAERAALCSSMVEWCVARADQLGEEQTWQMGRPVTQSPDEIRPGFQERSRYLMRIAEEALADVAVEPREGFRRFIRREPLGVVLVLAPWNYPWLTSVNAIVPALLAGNVVILKIAEQTPLVAERYQEAFDAAGLPAGAFQFVHASHEQVARLVGDERIGHVAFTGSVRGGHAVQRAASGRFIAPGLELGGKDPAYVRSDARLESAIAQLVDGAFYNSGQSCCGIERIYVDRAVFRPFVDGFCDLARRYRLGHPLDRDTDLGPMVRTEAADAVRAQVREAVAMGARTLLDAGADRPGTPYLPPQVLVDVHHRMTLMTEETFGPVVGIMPVGDEDEAVALMNDSRYGLTASIWTTDEEAALRVGDRIETGTWFMNRCDHLDPALAWTGVKDSGRGCTLSRLGLEAMTRPKSFHLRLSG